jgi:hypothetical protein
VLNLIKFGDVFVYKGTEWVFLAKTEELLFAAQILDKEQTAQIDLLFNKLASKGSKIADQIKDKPLYCYVVLETEKFKRRAAHFKTAISGKSTNDNELFFDKILDPLIKSDLVNIKKQIINGPFSKLLKDIVRDIDI